MPAKDLLSDDGAGGHPPSGRGDCSTNSAAVSRKGSAPDAAADDVTDAASYWRSPRIGPCTSSSSTVQASAYALYACSRGSETCTLSVSASQSTQSEIELSLKYGQLRDQRRT